MARLTSATRRGSTPFKFASEVRPKWYGISRPRSLISVGVWRARARSHRNSGASHITRPPQSSVIPLHSISLLQRLVIGLIFASGGLELDSLGSASSAPHRFKRTIVSWHTRYSFFVWYVAARKG